jgi:hypothetical protein
MLRAIGALTLTRPTLITLRSQKGLSFARQLGGEGFPLNREIPETNCASSPLYFTHSMQSSICIPRAEETFKPKNSNSIEHPNEV